MVGEHILKMEKKLGRPLEKGEIVHHKDFHKPNNDETNLKNITRKQHQQLPAFQAVFILEKGLMDEFWIWWEKRKDNLKTPEQIIECKLVQAENVVARHTRKNKGS